VLSRLDAAYVVPGSWGTLGSLNERRRAVLAALDRAVSVSSTSEILDRAADLLRDGFPHYSWVGIYLLQGEELVLGFWNGPEATEHVHIPLGVGVHGVAARSGRTIVVDDLSEDPYAEYGLSSFAWARSEIVVPIAIGKTVLGVVAIVSEDTAGFDDGDRTFLERVARMLSSRIAG
jgi:L-methionine (R)-S-oxide reductase